MSYFIQRLACALVVLASSAVANAAVYTLSQTGIMALDVTISTAPNLNVTKTPTGNGVLYEITVPANAEWTTTNESWYVGGQKTLVGIPTRNGDQLSLQYTLVAAPANALVTATAVINNRTDGPGNVVTISDPVVLGGGTTTTVSTATTTETSTSVVGTALYVTPTQKATWPAGGTLRVLVTPAPGATVIGPTDVEPLTFIPIVPCRAVDTRLATGPLGGPVLQGNTSRDFPIPASACGIPATAKAYSMNVAVVPSAPLSFMVVWPAGQSRPTVGTLTSPQGYIKSTATIVPADSAGNVSVYSTAMTHVILDVNGYFVPSNTANSLTFYPVPPCRIADTRDPAGPLGGPYIPANGTRTFPIALNQCGIPSTARAYSVNFAALPRQGTLRFLTAYPTGNTQPVVATLNAYQGTITSNAAIVPAGTSGSISVFATEAADLVIDVNGYFAPPLPAGLYYYAPTPCRVLDTRTPSNPINGTRDINVAGSGCGLPVSAGAYVFGATVLPQTGIMRWLTLWPQGTQRPAVASLNAYDGATTSNLAIVPAMNGSISAFTTESAHLVLDSFGYFAQ